VSDVSTVYTETARPAGKAVRLDLEAADVGRGFGRVVIAIAEILRELLERQAIRRVDAGDLDDDHIERLGAALLRVRQQLLELRAAFEMHDEETAELFGPSAAGRPEPHRRDER
jgi:hypothetical protein